MTSPVDTTVKWFTSDMLGSPILKGQAGSLIALLDACLVNGWGVQAATSCVVLDGICTMTFPLDHAAPVEAVILVEGASIASLNGEQKVTAIAPNVVKFATAAANGTATGTITAKMAPGGWAKPFSSGTTVGCYKSLSLQANGQFCRVNDASATAARVIGYETMTAVSTGTALFPTSAQRSGGQYWQKSLAAGTAVVEWSLITDGRAFYFLPANYMAVSTDYRNPTFYLFGDPINLGKIPDPFNTLLIGETVADAQSGFRQLVLNGGDEFHFSPRNSNGTGTATTMTLQNMSSDLAADSMFDRHSGQTRLSEIAIKTTNTASWRAKLPGFVFSPHRDMELLLPARSVITLDTPARKYLALLGSDYSSSNTGMHLTAFDITGPWR